MIIKVLLICGILSVVVIALRGGAGASNTAFRRITGVMFAVAGVLSVLFPNSLSWIANKIGVGRGTDLLLYGLVVAFLYVTVALYQRVHLTEQRIAELSRAIALIAPKQHAADPESSKQELGEDG